ncbi:hypothetical protein [Atlantibacter sp.]|uniref:hypothetical protein n=1 Tax=Atlantibacter sp. TaxID=1903473 RepID=UPI0028AA6983|nr:hypothetical protein [Atlantibacter sp.]
MISFDSLSNFQYEENGRYKNSNVIALPGFINLHSHLFNKPRYTAMHSMDFLNDKPNGEQMDNCMQFNTSLKDAIFHGTKVICSSVRPEYIDKFIQLNENNEILVIPFLSIKNYHDVNYIENCLSKLERYLLKKGKITKPGLLIHSLYNMNYDKILQYLYLASSGRYILSMHFFESESEKIFYETGNQECSYDVIYEKLLMRWEPKVFQTFVQDFLSDKYINKLLIHCNYLPQELINKYNNNFDMVICPSSCCRLANNINISMNLDNTCLATDGAFTNFGYNLLTELKIFQSAAWLKRKKIPLGNFLSTITVTPKKILQKTNLVKDSYYFESLSFYNFFEKITGFIPYGNEVEDFLIYTDSYKRISFNE